MRPRHKALRSIVCALSVLALGLTATRAAADQVHAEVGDAGTTVATAQAILGGMPLSTITGNIGANADVDIYRILITNPAAFSATTVGQPGTLGDTQLFLFRGDGHGVAANDDASGLNLRSIIPAGSLASIPEGVYLLAISSWNNDPVAPGGQDLFPPTILGDIVGPTGPGGAFPFTGWGTGFTNGTYQIALTGASSIPEPTTAVMLITGVAGLIGLRLRRGRR